jgi:peptide chain release factor 1
MKNRVDQLLERLAEVEALLESPHIYEDKKKYRALTQEHSYLSELKQTWNNLHQSQKQIEENRELLKGELDLEFCEMIRGDIAKLESSVITLQSKIEDLLVPPDPNDSKATILELRAGTGGDEAALFVGDCVRMYQIYADKQGWKYELLSCSPSEIGGFKEYIMVLSGPNVYRFLQYEAGTHRVQRVPTTETQGRVHTSAITIAVLIEPDEEEEVKIDDKELRVDTYRSSGSGGQHVNVTDSAVRLTHLPTGIVVYCQQERSQHKNKDKAMRLLRTRIADERRRKEQEAIASTRAGQVGSGDRSERIRTYNFPQNRVTDHRINLTLYNLDHVINGELDKITSALVADGHQQKLQGTV